MVNGGGAGLFGFSVDVAANTANKFFLFSGAPKDRGTGTLNTCEVYADGFSRCAANDAVAAVESPDDDLRDQMLGVAVRATGNTVKGGDHLMHNNQSLISRV